MRAGDVRGKLRLRHAEHRVGSPFDFEYAREQPEQLVRLYWFRQDARERTVFDADRRQTQVRHQNHGQLQTFRQRAQLARELNSIHIRHPAIDDEDIKFFTLAHKRERVKGRRDRDHGGTPRLEVQLNDFATAGVVFDHEQASIRQWRGFGYFGRISPAGSGISK